MANQNITSLKYKLEKIIVTKTNPIYKSHLYWSQKSFAITDLLISELTNKGDIIFDPFMGSGVSIFEAVKDKSSRNAIGVDINEVPIFIVQTLLQRQKFSQIKNVLTSFAREAHEKLDTVYELDYCGEKVKIKSINFDITNGEYIIKHANCLTVSSNKKIVLNNIKELFLGMVGPYEVSNIREYTFIENSKIAAKKGQDISSIFTPRNFYVLDTLIGIMNKDKYSMSKEVIRYVLLSMIHLCKITDTHSNSQWPLWIPSKNCIEKNVLDVLDRRISLTIDSLQCATKGYKNATQIDSFSKIGERSNFLLIKKGIQDVTSEDIPDNSVDLVITDPPYLGQVAYSEYMQLYEPFLDFSINFEDEIVVSSAPSRKKSDSDYFKLLNQSFEVISQKLKTDHYFCMYFHDSNLKVWNKIISSLAKNNLRFLTMAHISKTATLKNIISPKKSLNGDALLFFVKDKSATQIVGKETIEDIEFNIILEARHMLTTHDNKITTPQFYDKGLMELIINNGWLSALSIKYKSLVELFDKHFKWNVDGGYWSL